MTDDAVTATEDRFAALRERLRPLREMPPPGYRTEWDEVAELLTAYDDLRQNELPHSMRLIRELTARAEKAEADAARQKERAKHYHGKMQHAVDELVKTDERIAALEAELDRIRKKLRPVLTDERYRSFFGAQPDYGGDLSPDDLLERNWHE